MEPEKRRRLDKNNCENIFIKIDAPEASSDDDIKCDFEVEIIIEPIDVIANKPNPEQNQLPAENAETSNLKENHLLSVDGNVDKTNPEETRLPVDKSNPEENCLPAVEEITSKSNIEENRLPAVEENTSKLNIEENRLPAVKENTSKSNLEENRLPAVKENTSKANLEENRLPAVKENTSKANLEENRLPAVKENTSKSNLEENRLPAVKENTSKSNIEENRLLAVMENTSKSNLEENRLPALEENANKSNLEENHLPAVKENTSKSNIEENRLPAVEENATKSNLEKNRLPAVGENTNKSNLEENCLPAVNEHVDTLNPEDNCVQEKDSLDLNNEKGSNAIVKNQKCQSIKKEKKMHNPTIVPLISSRPSIYNVTGKGVSVLFAPKHLPQCFESLPEFNGLMSDSEIKDKDEILRKWIGEDLSLDAYAQLANFCSSTNSCTGNEITIKPDASGQGHMFNSLDAKKVMMSAAGTRGEGGHLRSLQMLNLRLKRDQPNTYGQCLKYRSRKLSVRADVEPVPDDMLLKPGKDLIYRIRIYRPFNYGSRLNVSRCPQFSRDLIMLGSQTLAELRDSMICPNDFGSRLDSSSHGQINIHAKDLFPSGFLFINNVFYNDMRSEKCIDYSAPIRAWAKRRGIGDLPSKSIEGVRLDDLEIKLGYPESWIKLEWDHTGSTSFQIKKESSKSVHPVESSEVYVHQGNCEHLFTISEVRVMGSGDQLNPKAYPHETAHSGGNLVYCNSCAVFASKWVVVNSDRMPFDPAYLCNVCYKLFFFKEKKKLGVFKSYPYVGSGQKTFQI